MAGRKVRSNAEAGEGYSDINVEIEDKEIICQPKSVQTEPA